MKRKTREEKVIEQGTITIGELKKTHNSDDKAFIEFMKLLEDYKKLSKRFNKSLQISDSVGKQVIVNNTKLQDNLDYTIKTAKNQIMNTVKEHRKTKDSLANISKDVSTIESTYKEKLRIADLTIKNLKEEVKELKKKIKE